jgi:hypothetical protein
MRYLLLITSDENTLNNLPEDEAAATSGEYQAWMKTMADRGALQGGERLRPTSDATTVRVRNGETLSTDGPFAETKEQLAGYFLVDCKDLDEAIDAAAKLPAALYGSVEVRPIWEM